MESVLYITSNAIRVYAISIFITSFLGKSRLNPGMNRLIYLLYFLISTVGWLYWKSPTLNLFLNTLPLLGITLQYDSGWSKKIFSVIISCAVGMFVDWIAIAAFGDVHVIKSGFVQCNVILICAVLFRRYYKRKETCLFRSKYVWLLIFTSIGTGAIGVMTVDENSPYDYIIATILLLINLFTFYVYHLEQDRWSVQYRLKLIESSNEAYRNQLQIVNESQKKIRFLKHDLNRHIQKLKLLSEKENMQAIVQYLNEMEDAAVIKQEYVKTGNEDVDSLLNYELSLAAEFGTEVICDVNLPENLNISSFDMTIILGNLMDNAIEALRHSKRKQMKVNIRLYKGIIRIDLENTYDPAYRKKHDGREHGIGLLSIENTLQKYHGKLDSHTEKNRYYTTVVFYNSLDE